MHSPLYGLGMREHDLILRAIRKKTVSWFEIE